MSMGARPNHGKGLKIEGAPSIQEINESPGYRLPGADITRPVPVIECIEEIPCNPCETSCPKGAITVGDEITNLPRIDWGKCTSCGICVAACPGLAVYLKMKLTPEGKSYIAFPFEYYPLPEKDQEVEMVDRYGDVVCRGQVVKVVLTNKNDRTAVVHAHYPAEYYETVVSMKRL